MPELPDVAHFKKYLDATSLHQTIRHTVVHDRAVLEGVSAPRLRNTLQNRSFESTNRWGKYLFVEVQQSPWLVMHFGMTGFLDYAAEPAKSPAHARVVYQFDSACRLAYVCQRKLGLVTLAEDIESFGRSQGLGPDAMDEHFDSGQFLSRLDGRRGAIKSALMNQDILAGVGNVYSDEILFQAGIDPTRTVGDLDGGELRNVYRTLRKVLRKAIDRNADVARLPSNWLLPHRERGRSCPRCGQELDQIKVSGRTAYVCHGCQH